MSPLLCATGSLAGAALLLGIDARAVVARLAAFATRTLAGRLSLAEAGEEATALFVRLGAPIALGALCGAMLVGVLQTRGIFTSTLRSGEGEGEAGRSFVAWATAGIALVLVLVNGRAALGQLARAPDLAGVAVVTPVLARALAVKLLGLFALGGAIDYFFRRAALERALRMTRAEREREQREEEGDPRLRGEARRRQRETNG